MRWWIKVIGALAVLALLLWFGWSLVGTMTGLLSGVDLNASEPDPMFAEEALIPTRPPELYAEEAPPERLTLDDLVPFEGAPVDKTADELIREAQMRDSVS